MIFNEIWTKEKNDNLREMIKENKSVNEIRDFFGDDLNYHPNKKYSHGISSIRNLIINYNDFVNEIYINKFKEVEYKSTIKISKFCNDVDYIIDFKINTEDYVLIFMRYDTIYKSFNLVFTTKKQYIEYDKKFDELKKSNNLNQNTYQDLINILEKETNSKKVNPFELMNVLSYIILDFYNKIVKIQYPNIFLSLGETMLEIKLKLYRDIIKNTFKDIDEIKEIDQDGGSIYYYKIK